MSRDYHITRFTVTRNPYEDFRDRVPQAGELIFLADTEEMLIGDGVRDFIDLPYIRSAHTPGGIVIYPEGDWNEQGVTVNADDLI